MKPRNRIKVVLAERDLQAMYLVEALGVSKTTVSRWYSNTQQPTLAHLYSIAELLGVSVCSLLVETELASD